MKLFLSQIIVKHLRTGETTTSEMFFLQAFGVIHGYQMRRESYQMIGTASVPNGGHYDTIPYSLRGTASIEQLKACIKRWADDRWLDVSRTVDHEFREVTANEHKWFMTNGLYTFVSSILHEIGYGLNDSDLSRRIRAIAQSMQERAPRPGSISSPVTRAQYKDMLLSEHGYKRLRNFCKKVGAAIRRSIAEQDASICEDVFMELYDKDISFHDTVFDHLSIAMRSERLEVSYGRVDCGHIEAYGNTTEVRVRNRLRDYCEACAQDEDIVVYAHDTDELILRDAAYYDDYNNHWLANEPDSDDAYDSGDSDDNRSNTDRLMSYSTNALEHLEADASFTSAPFGNFLMGVELEMVTRESISAAVRDVRSQLGEEYCICKNDGSLPDGGLEIVTAPRTLDEHIERFSQWTVSSDYNAWKNGRCGMHVHIDSRAFTSLTLGKFIMLMNTEANAEFIRKIAGRHPLMDSQARSYCRTESQSELSNPSKALKGKSSDRYTIVNIANLKRNEAKRLGVNMYEGGRYNTVELRIFRASLKKERLLAQIEFTHAAVMFCRVASMRDLDGVSFLKWLKTTDNRYPYLADWYGVRRRPTAKNAEPAEVKCEDVVPAAVMVVRRHHIDFPQTIAVGDDSLRFINNQGLNVEYGRIADTDLMYFPYGFGPTRTISADDVVYTMEGEQWHLQPAGTLANANVDALALTTTIDGFNFIIHS